MTMIKLITLLRSPVRTALTLILLGVVTFALFTQITEYAVATRELRGVRSKYCGIGTVEKSQSMTVDPLSVYSPKTSDNNTYRFWQLSREQVDVISSLPYVTQSDARYMTSGVSDDYSRMFRWQADSFMFGTARS